MSIIKIKKICLRFISVKERQWAWTKKYSMIYIDNPVSSLIDDVNKNPGFPNIFLGNQML